MKREAEYTENNELKEKWFGHIKQDRKDLSEDYLNYKKNNLRNQTTFKYSI